jgi:nucleotide-binding universal stress UspA family protein
MSHPPAAYSIPTKILLPIDFSSSSDAALQMGADLAQHFHAELCLLHVVPIFSMDNGTEYVPDTQFLQDARDRAEQRLAACVAVLVAKGLKATFVIEIGNDVVGNIMSVVEQDHIDMMVLSTHGVSGWRAVVFGSIAEKVVRLVQCPLLLLHSPKSAVATKSFHSMSTAFPLSTPIHTA